MSDHYPICAAGLISGTSMDAIDVACIVTDGKYHSEFVTALSRPYAADLHHKLTQLVTSYATTPNEVVAKIEQELNLAYVDAIKQLMTELPATHNIKLIGLHGQTIFHDPKAGFSHQLGSGEVIAATTRIDVIDNFRHADMQAGGQGAPLAPLYHACLAVKEKKPLVILNLGGVANLTYINDDQLIAFDTGPASALLDDFMQLRRNVKMDVNGDLASTGTADRALIDKLLGDDYFALAPPKSLDRNHFAAWQNSVIGLSDADGAATLTALTAACVAAATTHLPSQAKRWLVTGGGRHNMRMMHELRSRLGNHVGPIEKIGARGDSLEAELFAYLAVRSERGLPLTMPSTTGVKLPASGGVKHRVQK